MTKKLQTQNHFQSSDISLCAALYSYGYALEAIDKSNPSKAIFSIKKDEKIDEVIQQYWTHKLLVEPMSFFNSLREIKNRLYQA